MERFKRTVKSPFSGQEYQIVKVSQRDLFEHLGLLPLIIATPVGKELDAVRDSLTQKLDDAEESQHAARFLLERGVLSPKIWFADGECPAGHLPYDYMGDDRYWVSTQISNFAFGVGEFRMDKFFRGPDPGDPGPGGPEVRTEAVEPDTNGSSLTPGHI